MRLRTERLQLTPLGPADLDLAHALWSDAGMRRYLLDDRVIDREEAAEFLRQSQAGFKERGLGLWRAGRAEDPAECIGFCGFFWKQAGGGAASEPRPDLLYGLLPAFWGRGYAREMAREMLRCAFVARGCALVTAGVDTPNLASVRLLEEIGMRFLRREREPQDLLFYEMTAEVWHEASREVIE